MEEYNLDKLVKKRVNDFYKSRWYTFEKSKTFLGFTIRKEGFYKNFFSKSYYGLDCPKNHTLINGIVYENPEVILSYEGGVTKTYYFTTLKEATAFLNKINPNGNWIR